MEVKEFNIHNTVKYDKWRKFLTNQGISGFAQQEIDAIDKTFVWLDNTKIIATGSVAGNVLKYVAIDANYKDNGSMFNQVISRLINEAAQLGRFHLFVFTKPKYIKSFEFVGFKKLAEVEEGAVLEGGTPNINDYINQLPHIESQNKKRIAAIVMNANPFTLGHRYLVEQASKENDVVYDFVVSQDVSLFKFKERFKLVKEGTQDLENVIVVPGKEYMVSYATFPAYFLKDDKNVGRFQAKLDAELFKERIARPLNITHRYLGSEPYSKTTDVYNEELSEVLPPTVNVHIINRKVNVNDKIITATQVRHEIKENNLEAIKDYVPVTTFRFIKENWNKLRSRFKEV